MTMLAKHDGSISAWAEEPPTWLIKPRGRRVDLRVGGGAERPLRTRLVSGGRSPRGRRSHNQNIGICFEHGSIAARGRRSLLPSWERTNA